MCAQALWKRFGLLRAGSWLEFVLEKLPSSAQIKRQRPAQLLQTECATGTIPSDTSKQTYTLTRLSHRSALKNSAGRTRACRAGTWFCSSPPYAPIGAFVLALAQLSNCPTSGIFVCTIRSALPTCLRAVHSNRQTRSETTRHPPGWRSSQRSSFIEKT